MRHIEYQGIFSENRNVGHAGFLFSAKNGKGIQIQ
jgi:hypothetical protein